MLTFLLSLVEAIPAAATSRAGLTAFAIAAAAYLATVWRVSRNKQILANLQKLSPEDRLPALELEMGGFASPEVSAQSNGYAHERIGTIFLRSSSRSCWWPF
jgi:hypothetical protein